MRQQKKAVEDFSPPNHVQQSLRSTEKHWVNKVTATTTSTTTTTTQH